MLTSFLLFCRPKYEFKHEKSKCLISYYGATNETCWYKSNTESIEADFQDTLGEHQVGSITQENKCVFNKRAIKVCVSCSWRCPGTFAPSEAYLTVSLIL